MAALCPPALWREQLVQLLCGRESDLGVVLWAPSPDPVRGFGSPVITLPRAETRVKSVLFHFPKMLRPGSRLLIHLTDLIHSLTSLHSNTRQFSSAAKAA